MTTKLLAVDDSKTLRKVLEITFAGEDFHTELAGNSDEAMARLRSNRPRIALVDASLAGASGYDLCAQIKSEAPDVAVMILSSKHRPYDQSRGLQVGADDFMDKPFDTQKLIDKVNALAARPVAAVSAPHVSAPQVSAAQASAPVVSAQPTTAPAFGGRPAAPSPAVSTAPRPVAPNPLASAAPRPVVSAAPARPASPAPRPVVSAAPVAPAPVAPAPVAAPAVASRPPAAAPHIAAAAVGADFSSQLSGLGLSAQQVEGVLALSRDVVERVVWEVVPVLAETLIKEELARLTAE